MTTSAPEAVTDPYIELGITPQASDREIKAAYRRLAARWHPDRNRHPQAAERMARINQAYNLLCEPEDDDCPPDVPPTPEPARRAQAPAEAPAGATPGPDEDAGAPEPPPRSQRPWWERDWGRTRWEPDGHRAPETIHHRASLRLEDAAFGCMHVLEGRIGDLCPTCAGSGRLLSRRSDCSTCGGQGRLRATPAGRWKTCAACRGDGLEHKDCEDCEGQGVAAETRAYRYEVRIPGGLRDGQSVLLRGQGQRGVNGAGDIELGIDIPAHPLFGFDAEGRLRCQVPVDIYTALAAGEISVPTLDGGFVMLDPAHGASQVLEGVGYPGRDGRRGPLVVETIIVTPGKVSEAQRQLLRQLAAQWRSERYADGEDLAAWQRRLEAWQLSRG